MAKDVSLVAVRVLNCSGSGSTSSVIAGINWVTNHHTLRSVANMSLGGGASTALDTAVANSIASGVVYGVAAGNESANACNGSPSRVPAAITVGATTSTDARASFSNFGTCVDIFAPGQNITSSWYRWDTATNTISGTSMATPHVVGAAARLLEGSSLTPQRVRDAMVANATPNVVSNPGTGSPNRLLYTPVAGTPTPDPTPPPTCPTSETATGTFTGTGSQALLASCTSSAGTHGGVLTGPAGVDFDVYLQKLDGTTWTNVAQGIGTTANETVTYSGTAGTYRWRVVSYRGSGDYTLQITRPQ